MAARNFVITPNANKIFHQKKKGPRNVQWNKLRRRLNENPGILERSLRPRAKAGRAFWALVHEGLGIIPHGKGDTNYRPGRNIGCC